MAIDYRRLVNIEDLQQAVDLEIVVWGMPPRDAVPANLMRSVTMHGGLVIGAYDGERLVGMSLALPLRPQKKLIVWSHMAGVHPDYQGQNVGFCIKQAQRIWALEQGYDEMRWTYDPLQRGNANFNLRRLGASASIYHRDYYGHMGDSINIQTASDRLEVIWKLRDQRVKALAQGVTPVSDPLPDDSLLTADASGSPIRTSSDAPSVFVQIPRSIKGMDFEQANAWRLALRAALEESFARGYVAVDFVEQGDACGYILRAPTPWYLYVLRCSDDSFYTGITNDLKARLKQHNAGKGAAYTAVRLPVTMLAAWQFPDRGSALQAEAAFKKLKRAAKQAQIESGRLYRNATAFVQEIQ